MGSASPSSRSLKVVACLFLLAPQASSAQGVGSRAELHVSVIAEEITCPETPEPVEPADDASIADVTPRFVWSVYQHGGDGETQSGYEVRVRSDTDGDVVVYETGFVASGFVNWHTYDPGAYTGIDPVTGYEMRSQDLVPGKSYHWQVRYRDSGGDWSLWSSDGAQNHQDFYVTAANGAPVAWPAEATTDEDVPVEITLEGAHSPGSVLTYAVATPPSHGTVALDGVVATYTPAEDHNGIDSFTFTASYEELTSDPATVSITVSAVNDAPVATAAAVTADEDVPIEIILTGTDVEGSALTFAIDAPPLDGTVALDGAVATYTPAVDFYGADSFTFRTSDGELTSDPATLSIAVSAVNDAPVATAAAVATDEDVPTDITLTGTDVEGSALTFAIDAPPLDGTVALDGAVATYTPAADFHGTDSFTFTASDGELASDPATVSITVNSVPDLALELTTQPGGSVSGQPLTLSPVVRALRDGSVDSSVNDVFHVSLASGTGSLSGTLTATAEAGVATFANVIYTAVADGELFSLQFDDDAGVGDDFAPVISDVLVSDVTATQLVFTVEPAGSVSGLVLAIQPAVTAVDANLSKDAHFESTVVMSLSSGPGILSGTVSVDAVAGVASYTDLVYTATADNEAFSLQAVLSTDLSATSAAVNSDVVATQLIFSTQPAAAANTSPMGVQPVVAAQDADFRTDAEFAETVTLTATGVTGSGALSGDADVAAVAGVATFVTVQYDVDTHGDTFRLTADDEDGLGSDLPSVNSATIAGIGKRLVLQIQPGGSTSGQPLATQPVVVADLGTSVDPTYAGNVALSLQSGNGTLSGILTMSAATGVATFADIVYTATDDHEAFRLRAVDEGGDFSAGVSEWVASEVVATRLVYETLPDTSYSGKAMNPAPQVAAQDDNGLTDVDFGETVELTLGSGLGLLAGTLGVSAEAGVATFADVSYTVVADLETFDLVADDEAGAGDDLPAVTSPPLVGRSLLRVEIPLAMGYNLVSWNVSPPDSAIASLATPIVGNLIQVLGFETISVNPNSGTGVGAKLYDPTLGPGICTLVDTDYRLGYWFKMSAPDVLQVAGAPADAQTPIPLASGPNLVAYLPTFRDQPGHAIDALLPGMIQVLGFERAEANPSGGRAGGKLYNPDLPGFINTLKVMAPRLGYWVTLGAADTLVYPTEADPVVPAGGVTKSLASSSPAGDHAYPTDQWMGIYGQLWIRDESAPLGTVVDVIDAAGNTAAWSEVHHAGNYGYLPIYLDDPDTERDEGADMGEWLTVRVNGYATDSRVQWTEFGDLVELDLKSRGQPGSLLPPDPALGPNYPNPFNASTTITYQLPSEQQVILSVWDLAGQLVRGLVQAPQTAGCYSVTWDGRNGEGSRTANGVYIYQIRAGEFQSARKMVLVK